MATPKEHGAYAATQEKGGSARLYLLIPTVSLHCIDWCQHWVGLRASGSIRKCNRHSCTGGLVRRACSTNNKPVAVPTHPDLAAAVRDGQGPPNPLFSRGVQIFGTVLRSENLPGGTGPREMGQAVWEGKSGYVVGESVTPEGRKEAGGEVGEGIPTGAWEEGTRKSKSRRDKKHDMATNLEVFAP